MQLETLRTSQLLLAWPRIVVKSFSIYKRKLLLVFRSKMRLKVSTLTFYQFQLSNKNKKTNSKKWVWSTLRTSITLKLSNLWMMSKGLSCWAKILLHPSISHMSNSSLLQEISHLRKLSRRCNVVLRKARHVVQSSVCSVQRVGFAVILKT